ncbi:MAG: hypothetical protein JEY71_15090 [Sphaerochaeta sp.]|nr:hypothetical protein [Sphaerochaeta sp.]
MAILLNLSWRDDTVSIGIVEEEVIESSNKQGASSSLSPSGILSLVFLH